MKHNVLKRPLACLYGAFMLATLPLPVLAGSTPVIEPDSGSLGLGDGFAADVLAERALKGPIGNAFAETLEQIISQGQVNAGGQVLLLTSEEIAAFDALLTGGAEAEAALAFLVEQISADLDTPVDVSVVSVSVNNLRAVVARFNALIASLNQGQLLRAFQSAPLQALLRALQAASQVADVCDGDINDCHLSAADLDESTAAILILLQRL